MTLKSREETLARAAQEDQTPKESLTSEQLKRKYNREKKRKERNSKRKEKAASTALEEHEWWNGNRSALSSEDFEVMFAQDGRVRDQLYWMDHGYKATAEDIVYISLEEGVAELVEFVKKHGVAHLGYVSNNGLPPDWPSLQYWRDAELIEKLESENKQTAQYVRYGLLAGLPDWRVVEFLTEKAKWSWQQAAALVGWRIDYIFRE
jgi:hypothetical protein